MRAGFESATAATTGALAVELRRSRDALLARWPARVHRAGEGGPAPKVAAAAAALLDGLAGSAAAGPEGGLGRSATRASERYALRRQSAGVSLRQVVTEVAGLRDAVLDLWRDEHGRDLAGPSLRFLNRAIDAAVAAASERYLAARGRTMRALDRMALETRVRELETVVESIPDAVFVADAHRVHHANRAAMELFGADSMEALNRSAQSLAEVTWARHVGTGDPLSPDERPIARALRGESSTGEVVVRHLRTGRDVILRYAVAPVVAGGRIVGAVGACTDITQRKAEEAERERLFRQAEQAVADRQHVLGIVSHDLRNPLNTISIAAQLLKDGEGSPERAAKGLAAITRAVSAMNRMISDLLDAHSIEGGRLALSPMPQDPASVVDEVMELFAPQAASRGVSLVKAAPPALPWIQGDRHRLVQALSNLVSNALKVTPQGGAVEVRVEPRGPEVAFSVTDDGPGVPEEGRDQIFEPYWRAKGSAYKGTGLGLAIVRGVVEGHGGRVWIENTPGRGAAFRFTVPVA